MIAWLHSFQPHAIALSLGPLNLYWYGIFVVSGMAAALLFSLKMARLRGLRPEIVFDTAFWLIIAGLIGARIYDILLQLPYYLNNPWRALMIWKGGLAIHGGILAGLLVLWFSGKKSGFGFFKLAALFTPGLALGQAIGRWGNYFNQEIFGWPTSLPWGIPISLTERPLGYLSAQYFHPTFLYESLGCLIIFFVLWLVSWKKNETKSGRRGDIFIVCLYLILYSLLRFSLEFIRLDPAPDFLGLRWPQIMSLILGLIGIAGIIISQKHAKTPAL